MVKVDEVLINIVLENLIFKDKITDFKENKEIGIVTIYNDYDKSIIGEIFIIVFSTSFQLKILITY